ncbi:MAG: hypothetical protein NZ873_01560 [Crenarchaeota archaeon]|nr:hypothetical protein [Thermoproteota archaeon]
MSLLIAKFLKFGKMGENNGYLTARDGVKLFYRYWLPERVEKNTNMHTRCL